MSEKGKVLFAASDFKESAQRGIYFFAKSLITAVKAKKYTTGILTDTPTQHDLLALRESIYKDLTEPEKTKLIGFKFYGYYLKHNVLKVDESVQLDTNPDQELLEKMWFLQDIDHFLNLYKIYALLSKTETKHFLPAVDVAFTAKKGWNTVFTASPLNLKTSNKKVKIIQTIHDLIVLNTVMQNESTANYLQRVKAAINYSDKILAVSEYTKGEILERFKIPEERVAVVYQPIPSDRKSLLLSESQLVQDAVLSKFNLEPKNYIFYIGTIELRKNSANLIAAHRANKNKYDAKLILAGHADLNYVRSEGLSAIFESSENQVDKDRIGYLGSITEVEKLCLLRNAAAFVFPSYTEGFGIPPLEAQSLGCPVLTTKGGALPEVVKDSAHLIENPDDVEEIAEGLLKVYDNEQYSKKLIDLGKVNAQRFNKTDFAIQIDQLIASVQ